MRFSEIVRDSFSLISGSSAYFHGIGKESLEDVLERYIKLVLVSGLLAGLTTFLFFMGRGLYLDLVRDVTVQYLRLLNYSFSIGAGTFFSYLFFGTFGAGLVALICKAIARIRLVDSIKVICVALTPVLLFGWLSPTVAGVLLIWAGFFAVSGFRILKSASAVRVARRARKSK